MSGPSPDLQAVFTEAVRQRLTAGDWQIVAVTPAAVLSWRLRGELDKAFGALHEPVLVVIERRPDAAEEG
jgi:hypothetical protein